MFLVCRDDEEPQPSTMAAPPPQAVNPNRPSVQEAELFAEAPRVTRSSVKKVAVSRSAKKAKKTKETDVSLEAHEPASSSDNVSDRAIKNFSSYRVCLYVLALPGADEEIRRLGY
jgi:hypothetical protein